MADHGVHLTMRAGDAARLTARVAALPTAVAAHTVGLRGVLDRLERRATPTKVPGTAPVEAWRWNDQDFTSRSWWPQGITTSADASSSGVVEGRELVATSWYSKGKGPANEGSRITFLDVETLRYRHVLVVRATKDGLKPLPIHAGGLLWYGDHLHLAATKRGLFTCNIDDVVEVEPGPATFGYRFVLPVRHAYAAGSDATVEDLRYSFVSVDRADDPPQLLAGEYGVGQQSTRIVRYAIDPETGLLACDAEGTARPTHLDPQGVGHMQGVALVGDRYYVTTSRGARRLGHLYAGTPGRLRAYRWALPPGPEDISYWPQRDQLWSLTEHPGKRYVFAMDRAKLRRFPWLPFG